MYRFFLVEVSLRTLKFLEVVKNFGIRKNLIGNKDEPKNSCVSVSNWTLFAGFLQLFLKLAFSVLLRILKVNFYDGVPFKDLPEIKESLIYS